MKISNLKKIIPFVGKLASLVARQLGHWYMNGMAYGKHLVALAVGNIFMCSDRELPEELKDRGLLAVLDTKILQIIQYSPKFVKMLRRENRKTCGTYNTRVIQK